MRGITVNSCVGKILFKIIQKRMMASVEERSFLGPIQHGFRGGYQTLDAIFTLVHTLKMQQVVKWPQLSLISRKYMIG